MKCSLHNYIYVNVILQVISDVEEAQTSEEKESEKGVCKFYWVNKYFK